MGPWPHLPQPLAPARPHVQVHLRHLLGQVQAMGHQLLRWQHAIHQAPSHGLLGADETTCQPGPGSPWITGWLVGETYPSEKYEFVSRAGFASGVNFGSLRA